MIKARQRNWADFIFKHYIYSLLKKHFHSVHVLGELPILKKDIPLIFTPNHATWWDGFFVYLLNKEFFKRKFYIMILEEQLSRYNFFVKLGGYSIDQKNPKKIVESLQYTAQMMKENRNSLFNIFPQGELLPLHTDLKYNSGIKKIIDYYEDNVQLINIAMMPLFLKEQNPQLFFKFGTLRSFNKSDNIDMKQHESEMKLLLNSIIKDVNSGDIGRVILQGKKSVSE
jgi:chlorobactene lauroyltransferase